MPPPRAARVLEVSVRAEPSSARTNVRFGSQADILGGLRDVRYSPKSGHRLSALRCPLRTMSGNPMR